MSMGKKPIFSKRESAFLMLKLLNRANRLFGCMANRYLFTYKHHHDRQ